MRLLIGYDGSEWADAAIDDLRRAGLPPDAEALVVAVADVWPQLPPDYYNPAPMVAAEQPSALVQQARTLALQAMEEAEALSKKAADRLRAMFPRWQVSSQARAGSVPQVLVGLAEESKADLIVVGSQGRSALGRLLFGSVSQKVLRYAPCSVRVGRPSRHAPDAPVRLVIGADGSPSATAAVRAAALRAWPAGSEARVATAVDVALLTALEIWSPLEESQKAAPVQDPMAPVRRNAESAASILREHRLPATPIVRQGDPKRVLVEEAEQWEADCIFVGAKGLSGLDRFLLGSVSAAVAARAGCSVEVVRGKGE